jgi:hypothetical protein
VKSTNHACSSSLCSFLHAVDVLPTDIQAVMGKVFQYFHQFTIRVESLKSFCDFVEIEYKTVLGHSKTRWLSLIPALDHFIELYDGLKSYFLTQDKCLNILYKFFSNRKSFIFLLFLKTQMKMFSDAIQRIEREEATGFEVKKEIDLLIMKLRMRQNKMFLHGDVKMELENLRKEGLMTEKSFKNCVSNFYSTAVQYIQEWSLHPVSVFAKMEWVSLSTSFSWENISECAEETKTVLPNFSINEESLFDDFSDVKMYATESKITEWNNASCEIGDTWKEIFAHFKKEQISYNEIELRKFLSYCAKIKCFSRMYFFSSEFIVD